MWLGEQRAPEFAKTCENKRAVSAPQREWLQNDLKDFVMDVIHAQSFKEMGVFYRPCRS